MRLRPKLHTFLLGVLLVFSSLTIATVTLWPHVQSGRLDPRRALGQAAEPTPASAPATPTPTPRPTETPPPRPIPPDLALTARAAILVDVATENVRYERQADEPVPPASTAKIVTALTAIAHLRPEEVVEIVPEDVVDPEAESAMGLQAGDTVTVQDLLVGLLLPSGNDAANALARVAGERLAGEQATPRERFTAAMNQTAERLGMADSYFHSPAGLDVDGQRATARDLARAARALLDDPALLPIVAMPSATVRVGGPQARVITLESTNLLLEEQGVYGVKTGTTELAGECLVFAYRDQREDVIGVVLGSQDRFGDARALLGLPPAPATPPASP